MENVPVRIHSGRTVLDSPNTWQTGPIRDATEVAARLVGGKSGDLPGPMEESSQGISVGSIPFDYSLISDRGLAPDLGSNDPKPDLAQEAPLESLQAIETGFPDTLVEPQEKAVTALSGPEGAIKVQPGPQPNFNDKEIREEMQTVVTPQTSLVKHNQVKALALELMADRFTFNGEPKFTRVSPVFVDALERFVYAAIVRAIQRHPSTGKIIKEF